MNLQQELEVIDTLVAVALQYQPDDDMHRYTRIYLRESLTNVHNQARKLQTANYVWITWRTHVYRRDSAELIKYLHTCVALDKPAYSQRFRKLLHAGLGESA